MMTRRDDWCRCCGGQGFVSEFDRDWTPPQRVHLFSDGRTAVCPRCGGDGREPSRKPDALVTMAVIAGICLLLGMAGAPVYMQVFG